MDELTRERFQLGRRRPPATDDAAIVAERRRILCGTDDLAIQDAEGAKVIRLAAARRQRDQKLAKAIRRWSA